MLQLVTNTNNNVKSGVNNFTLLLEDLYKLNYYNIQAKNYKLEHELINEKIINNKLLLQNLKLQIQQIETDIQYLENKKNKINDDINYNNEIYKKELKTISNKYNINTNWGYNPETGQVIIEPNRG